MKKLHLLLSGSTCLLLLFFLTITIAYNFLELDKEYVTYYFTSTFIAMAFFFIFVFFVVSIRMGVVWKENNLALILFSISLISKLIFIYLVQSKPESDFKVLYDAAKSYSHGDIKSFNGVSGNYFDVWAYQSIFTLYQSLLLYIYDSIDILKIVNCFFIAGSSVFVYQISRFFSRDEIAFSIAILYSFLPEITFYSPLLSNQHISIFFVLGGVYCFLRDKGYLSYLVSGILLAIGNLMRPEVIIILLAILLYSVLSCIFKSEKLNISKRFYNTALLFIVYFAANICVAQIIKASEVNIYGVDNRNPEWKFMVGLDKENNGAWNRSHGYILSMQNQQERRNVVLKYLSRTYKSPSDFIALFKAKHRFMWASPTPVYFTFNDGALERVISLFGNQYYMNDLLNIYLSIDKIYYISILLVFTLSVLMYMCLMSSNYYFPHKLLLIYMICLLNFGVYLIIEVQPRYRYSMIPFVFIGSSFLLNFLMSKSNCILKQFKIWHKI